MRLEAAFCWRSWMVQKNRTDITHTRKKTFIQIKLEFRQGNLSKRLLILPHEGYRERREGTSWLIINGNCRVPTHT